MGILAVVACAEHIKLTMKNFLGDSGPSASGKTLCSVQFTWGWPINIPRGGEAAVAITSTTSAIGNNLAGCTVVVCRDCFTPGMRAHAVGGGNHKGGEGCGGGHRRDAVSGRCAGGAGGWDDGVGGVRRRV